MLGYLERLLSSRQIEEIWNTHCELMAEFGFDRLIYCYIPFRSTPGSDHLEDALILSNHDPDYLREFLQDGVFAQAPMVRWSADHAGVCSWSEVAARISRGSLTDGEKQVWELNRRHDVTAGISISFSSLLTRSKAGIGLCAEHGLSQRQADEIWARYGRELLMLNNLTHLRLSTLRVASSRRNLTLRQKEVLEWVADGKTTADIALIMGLRPATVEKHLRLAREALDVETTAQAVLKAALQKQIFLDPGAGSSEATDTGRPHPVE